ncbi:MAG TPA: glycosyltransferase family 4 protein [Gaiellaceae bacterium]|nr:glycosyltransferase family 4 protein [Gaiellaceae bacterium]
MSGDRSIVLVAHDVHDRGGMERAFFELVARTAGERRFVVVARELDPRLRPLVEWRRIRTPARPFPLKFLLFALLAGIELRRVRGSLVHTLGAIVPNRADLATVQFCHAGFRAATGGLAPADAPPLRRLNTAISRAAALAFERWCYRPRRLRRFAAVSRGVAAELARHYGRVPATITPNGVELDRYAPDPATRAAVRGELGAREDELVVLFVAGDWDRKGLGVAIDGVAAAARETASPLALWVVGRGDTARFRRRAEAAGARVELLGPRDDAERYFRAADVFLLPTLYETFSLVAHEAAAAGLPVVATRVSGIDELVGDDEAGLLVERDPAAVADALVRLGDPELRRRLGEEAARRAANYSWERSVEAVRRTYRDLLEDEGC